jgi:hypothetical protein
MDQAMQECTLAPTIWERSMAERIEKSLLEVDFASLTRRTFTPSPAA